MQMSEANLIIPYIGRYQAGVTSYNNLLYAIGGCDSWNCLNSVEVYDPKENSWDFTKSIITARRGCGVAVFQGKLYAIGGSDGTHSLSSTEVYDSESQCWVPGPSLTTPRANVSVAMVGNRLYAVGGFSGELQICCRTRAPILIELKFDQNLFLDI